MNILYAIAFFASICGIIIATGIHRRMGVRFWVLPAILSAKCLIAWVFFENIIFDQPDAQAFYGEGEVLFQVYEQNPDDYYTLLTGSDETKAIIDKYLSNTFHWNQGPQGVFNDNKNIIRVHSLIRFISMDMPAIHLMVFCLISLVGCCFLFLGIKDRTQLGPITVLLIVFFFPTIFFFSSAAMKEVFVVLGIGLLAYGFLKRMAIPWRIISVGLGAVCLVGFKPYILACLMPGLTAYIVYRTMPKLKLFSAISSLVLIALATILVFGSQVDHASNLLARKNWDFTNLGQGGVHVKSEDGFFCFRPDQKDCYRMTRNELITTKNCEVTYIKEGSLTLPQDSSISKGVVLPISFRGRSAGSYIDIPRLDGSKMSLIRNLPVALFNSMIRPFPWDPGSWPKHILFLETFGLICLVIFAIRHRRTMTNREKALILCLLIFCICLASLIGWVTPVLGAIVRYRLPIHIAIIIVGLTLIRNGKKAIE